jgi:hypothetical protein
MSSAYILYYYDQLFSHASQPKKSLTQNVFLLHYPNFFDLILTKFFQMFEELVVIVQYLFSQAWYRPRLPSKVSMQTMPMVHDCRHVYRKLRDGTAPARTASACEQVSHEGIHVDHYIYLLSIIFISFSVVGV